MQRSQKAQIIKDLQKKIVFLVGPRQVGKTWLAKDIAKEFTNSVYLNYDYSSDKRIIQNESWLDNTQLLILDEIHKMPLWKNYLKGLYDTKNEKLKVLVTGSARLDTIRQAGDSLAGRFFVHHLYPFSLKELQGQKPENSIDKLINRGGFPEPLLCESDADALRWRNQYIDGLIRNDILDFENIHNLKQMNLLLQLLRERVCSPLSYASLANDLQVSAVTVKKYIEILENLFIVFRIYPHSQNIARSILKESKLYFYDTGMVIGDQGKLYENMVAVSLLKELANREDLTGNKHSLSYLRTKEEKEVDFCILINNKPAVIMETKYSDSSLSKNLAYFQQKYNLPAIQLVKELKNERKDKEILILKADKYLASLEHLYP